MGIETQSKTKESDAGEDADANLRVHGIGVKAVSFVTGEALTPQEKRDIIDDAPLDEFASEGQTPPREYTGSDEIPFGD